VVVIVVKSADKPFIETATKDHWKILPVPAEREHFSLDLVFSNVAVERVKRGNIPEEMGDRWFIYFDEGWLYFHRSWTGACIFGVKLDDIPAGLKASDCWVSRDQQQYSSRDLEADRKTLARLIGSYFLTESQ
jgi:hypothetical protein